MGNSNGMKMCCSTSLCAPQYELQFIELEYPLRSPEVLSEQTNRKGNENASKDESKPEHISIIRESFHLELATNDSKYDDAYRHRLEQCLNYAKVLKLKVLSSSSLPKNTVICINALGYENSLRAIKDGTTYFGCKKRNKHKGEIINDIVIPPQDKSLAEKHRGQHFQIIYSVESDTYFIKDLAIGFGTFVRLLYPLELKDNYLLHIGDNFLLINLVKSNDSAFLRLRIKLFGARNTGDIFYFNEPDYRNSAIRIGRTPNCEIQIDDTLISKIQCTIYYEDEKWILADGDLEIHKLSTNGTWLYLNESFEIYDGMVFKSNHTLFQAAIL
ncbi:unnamed protein product [Blepharisma stoltei]|uniref:FHA domain-containing protein n=1 Tax=Blepharisma stoltei TaxID=1481888 RepID=A0AAU9J7T5_9CILI|nr:unnamed protein product [Blepharisma stoltei]